MSVTTKLTYFSTDLTDGFELVLGDPVTGVCDCLVDAHASSTSSNSAHQGVR